MADLLELAARCEAATGADRELDGCIWWACLSSADVEHFDPTGFVRRCIEKDGSAGVALQQFFDSSNPICLARIAFEQRYTASLDAAMTLASGFVLLHLSDIGADGLPLCKLGDPTTTPTGEWAGIAARLELAVCATALRARAALASEVGK